VIAIDEQWVQCSCCSLGCSVAAVLFFSVKQIVAVLWDIGNSSAATTRRHCLCVNCSHGVNCNTGRRTKAEVGRRSNSSNTFFMLFFVSRSQSSEQPTAQHTDMSNTTYRYQNQPSQGRRKKESRFVVCMDRRPCDMMRSWGFLVD
jgi:hypothetical protein